MRRVVVVGAGQAGVQAAVSLRDRCFGGEITLVGHEDAVPYQRPPLSKEYLTGPAAPHRLALRAESVYADRRIELVLGDPVRDIDRPARTVRTASGRELGYDRLVLATGAAARLPDLPGIDLDGVLTLRSVTDADRLRTRLAGPPRDVLVAGAGFVGLEVAATARARGHRVVVVESADRVLARSVSPEVSAHVAAHHRAAGIDVRTGCGLRRVRSGRDGSVTAVETTDGSVFAADVVVAGLGARPRTGAARRAGRGGGRPGADARMRTSDPAVYAIGDCAAFPGPSGSPIRLESVQNAVTHGELVASVLTGSAPSEGSPYLPTFWSTQGDLRLQIAGLVPPDAERRTIGSPSDGAFSVLHVDRGRAVAVESIGRPADHMAARRLIPEGLPVDALDRGVVDLMDLLRSRRAA